MPRVTGVAALELPAGAASGPGLVVVTQEPGVAESSAAAGSLAPLVSGNDRGTVDNSSMGESDTDSLVSGLDFHNHGKLMAAQN